MGLCIGHHGGWSFPQHNSLKKENRIHRTMIPFLIKATFLETSVSNAVSDLIGKYLLFIEATNNEISYL